MGFDTNKIYDIEVLGEDYVRKSRSNRVPFAISDVKLSELAREIDPEIATENLFAKKTHDANMVKINIASKLVTATDKFYDGTYKNLNVDAFNYDVYNKEECFSPKMRYYCGEYFQNLDLKKFINEIPDWATEKLQCDLVNQWLLANAFGILDMRHGNNVMIMKNIDTQEAFVTKAFDLEAGMHIVDQTTARGYNVRDEIVYNAYDALSVGMDDGNIEFMRNNPHLKKIADEFFDKLTAVRDGKMTEILDFTKLCPVMKEYLKPHSVLPLSDGVGITQDYPIYGLGVLAERATKGYKHRFTMLANQYAKPQSQGVTI